MKIIIQRVKSSSQYRRSGSWKDQSGTLCYRCPEDQEEDLDYAVRKLSTCGIFRRRLCESVCQGYWRGNPFYFPVYPLVGYQERQSSRLFTGAAKPDIATASMSFSIKSAQEVPVQTGIFGSWYAGGAGKWWAIILQRIRNQASWLGFCL